MEIGTVRMPAADAVDRVAKVAFGAATARNEKAGQVPGSDFSSLIQQALSQVNATQTQAESLNHQFQLGQNDVSVEDAMISMQKANISFQTTLQVRNKLMTAYNDIMNMQL